MGNKPHFTVAGIVTYNPKLDRLKENLDSIVSQVEHVYVYDNDSSNVSDITKLLDEYGASISVSHGNDNKGIAYGLNRICESAILDNYKWILTLDQDSVSPDNLINELTKYTQRNCGIVSPHVIYRDNEVFTAVNRLGIEAVQWVITSASLTNLDAWKQIGGFDEDMFIDGVDEDFCIRLNNAGYKVLKCYDVQLTHELGNLKCRKFLGKTIFVTNHSAFRYYYMVRNSVYLQRKLKTDSALKKFFKLLFKVCFYEDTKMEKVKYILKGLFDGFVMKIES